MLVRQLIGPYAGQLQEMPFTVAQNCIATGTACLPDDSPRVKGLKIAAPEPMADAPAAPKRKKAKRKMARAKKMGFPFAQ